MVEKLFPDPSLKLKIEHISGSTVSSFVQFVFIASQANSHRNILKLSCRPLAFISYKFFEKTKIGLELISLPHFLFSNFRFSPWFLKKNIYLFILYLLTKFHCRVAFTSWDIGQYVYLNYLLRPCDTDTYFRNIIFSNISEILFMYITDDFKLLSRSCAIKTLSK